MRETPPQGKGNRRAKSPAEKPRTRIQKRNRETILAAALEVFSSDGFHGATLDKIAAEAGLSKPNLLYYFSSKEAIYLHLLSTLMDTWLDPLRALNPDGDPIEEIVSYLHRKLEMSRRFPRESRLFAQEIVQGAPRILPQIEGELRSLVDETASVLNAWMAAGKMAKVDAHHLIFSIWSTTQHYADFDVQVQGILREDEATRFEKADTFLTNFYRRALTADAK